MILFCCKVQPLPLPPRAVPFPSCRPPRVHACRTDGCRAAVRGPLPAAARPCPPQTPQRSDADDVVQETWLRVVKVATSGLLGNGRAYLYRVAHNLIADHYRQRQRRREEVLDDTQLNAIADPAPLPEQRMLDAEQLRHLDAIIAALPPRSRQVFLLARVEQLALAEIGRQLGSAGRPRTAICCAPWSHCSRCRAHEPGDHCTRSCTLVAGCARR